MLKPRFFIPLLLGIIFIVVLLQNTGPVTLAFLLWEVRLSQIIYTLIAVLIGLAAGYILGRTSGSRRR